LITVRTSGATVSAPEKLKKGWNGQGNHYFLMSPANPTQLSSFAVTGFPSPTTAGMAGSFTVTATNGDGTTATGYTGTVHFTSSDAQAVLPGDYTFTAADAGVHTFSATLKTAGVQSLTATDGPGGISGAQGGITVQPAAASTLAIAGFPSSITAGVAGSFTVTARDAYGNTASGYTGTISFASSDPQAVLPGTYTFTSADKGVQTFSATLAIASTQSISAADMATPGIAGSEAGIVVTPAAASYLRITAPNSVRAGAAFSLTVTAVDSYGNVRAGRRRADRPPQRPVQPGEPAAAGRRRGFCLARVGGRSGSERPEPTSYLSDGAGPRQAKTGQTGQRR
jgi:hypothetical protein